jgi:hypothetical protein
MPPFPTQPIIYQIAEAASFDPFIDKDANGDASRFARDQANAVLSGGGYAH